MKSADISILDDLLAEPSATAKNRESIALEKGIHGSGGIVLFGSGHLGRKIARVLIAAGRPVQAFADNAKARWGISVEGIPILSPQDAAELHGDESTFIVSIWAPRHRFLSTKSQLTALGCRTVLPFMPVFWAYPDALPHYQFERPSVLLNKADQIRKAFDLWNDETSRRQYLSHISWRLRLDFEGLPDPSPEDQYFVDGLLPVRERLTFVDGGAFDGDTLRRMLACRGDNFERYLAFEPDPGNFSCLRKYWETLPVNIKERIDLISAAISDKNGKAAFDAAGATRAALSTTGDSMVRTVALDTFLSKGRPCYIKLDLEGAEREALEGAKGYIQKHAPDLAVCVYHRPADLWELPLLLSDWQPRYRFYLRTHDEDGLEIVAYATTGD